MAPRVEDGCLLSGGSIMRKMLVLCAVLGGVVVVAWGGGPFTAEGLSLGKTVLWFTTTEVDTDFDGTLSIEGTLGLDGSDHAFSVAGNAYGSGVADSATLAATLWVLFETEGTLGSGESVIVRGGMSIAGEDVDLNTLSLGTGTGTFLLVVEALEVVHWISGSVVTTASGAFVPAEIPTTMQIEGSATFTFDGAPSESTGEFSDRLPWDSLNWPAELHEELELLLNGTVSDPDAEA